MRCSTCTLPIAVSITGSTYEDHPAPRQPYIENCLAIYGDNTKIQILPPMQPCTSTHSGQPQCQLLTANHYPQHPAVVLAPTHRRNGTPSHMSGHPHGHTFSGLHSSSRLHSDNHSRHGTSVKYVTRNLWFFSGFHGFLAGQHAHLSRTLT